MRRIYPIVFSLSVLLVLAALIVFSLYGLQLGVDFTGGSVMELSFDERPESVAIVAALEEVSVDALADVSVSPAGDQNVVIRTGALNEVQHQTTLQALKDAFPETEITEARFDSIGPVIGNELKNDSITAIILVLIAIVLYIALVFRSMRRVLSPWAMGLSALAALAHDVIIPIGVFALLGHVAGVQVTAVFVAALLTILGYSVSDTVVIFDRVRENTTRGASGSFADVVHTSVLQTLGRSINTSVTTLVSLIAIWLFGGESIRYFALALILGIALGAYSSIFIASPLLVWMEHRRHRK